MVSRIDDEYRARLSGIFEGMIAAHRRAVSHGVDQYDFRLCGIPRSNSAVGKSGLYREQLGRADPGKEIVDVGTQCLRLVPELIGQNENLACCAARLAGRTGDPDDGVRHLSGA